MNAAERYRKSVEIFNEVCDLPAGDRDAFLSNACGDDAVLRRAVESLLEHDSSLSAAVVAAEQGAGIQALIATTSMGAAPTRIGQYQIVRRIGQGGMGVVFEARQEHPRRAVALKVLHAGFGAPGLIERFRREANVLGQLQHPGIAQVFDAGVGEVETEAGVTGNQPYIAMELIDGVSLGQWGRANDRSLRQRLEAIAQVCDALEHAHQRGVVHRDLKPGNILIDSSAQPKVLDFGIARITEGDDAAATLQTQTGQLLGTVPYMSPEQVTGDSRMVDVRTDVYALGALLYELLCGRLPYDLQHRSIAEAARVILEEEPTRLSQIDRSLRGDLDTIVSKALEKDRERRYPSAASLAADLRRYLGDQPIEARPASAIYNFRKFARRNRGLVGGLAATFLVLLIGAAGTSFGLASALRANKKIAQTNQELARTNEQLKETNKRLQRVTDFQSAQLTDIDMPLMGIQLRDSLLSGVAEDRRDDLESSMAEINFVDAARTMLNRTLFQRAIQAVDDRFADEPALQARLLQDLSKTMRELGLSEAAKAPQARALEIRRSDLGEDSRDTIDSIHESAMLAQALGDYERAETLAREALTRSERLFGKDARESLVCLGTVASIVKLRGNLDEAEALARRSMDVLTKTEGTADPGTLDAMSALAAVLMAKGEYGESEKLFRAVADERKLALGSDSSSTLSAQRNLANVLETQGKYDESTSLIKSCYEAERRIRGDDHPHTISTLREYAGRVLRQGRLEEAEPLAADALARQRRLLGSDHPDTLSSMEQVASILEERGKLVESEVLFKEVLDRRRHLYGENNVSTMRALGNYGFILSQQGKTAEALPIYRETLAGLRALYGNEHPHTLTSMGNLAALLSGMGQYEESEKLYRESLEARRRTLGEDHPSTLNAIYGMGDILRREGKLDEAETYCRQSLEGYRRVGGDDHIGTLYSLTSLGQLLLDKHEPADAEPLFREAVERRRRVNGDGHPQTAVATEGLAESLEKQDKWADAEQWRQFLLETAREAEPKDDDTIVARLTELGRNLLRQRKYDKSESVLRESLAAYERLGTTDDWSRWRVKAMLGECLGADADRRLEAERLMLDAIDQMTSTSGSDAERVESISMIRRRLADFYESWGLPDKARALRSDRDATASVPKGEPG
ncbi:MAG: tetratricopeptide repeat protein [Phycisphaerales bacterium]|nr:tetratricopeptide repeat protein [Phycisphaerales bacterium]MCB9864308.1 tetratricopeptide repeat protein [Phycisphaerales bacterium]